MRTIVITPPAPVVTYEEAVARLRLSGGEDERVDVEAMIAAATQHLDGPTGRLRRALGRQTLEARFDAWDCRGEVELPYPPIVSIVSVKYIDAAGVEQTVASDAYELCGEVLVPVYGASWPIPRRQREAIRVRYVAGYTN